LHLSIIATSLTFLKAAPTVGVAIINPNSGPGKRVDPNYVSQTKAAQAAGVRFMYIIIVELF
jgi:hypothetical protein